MQFIRVILNSSVNEAITHNYNVQLKNYSVKKTHTHLHTSFQIPDLTHSHRTSHTHTNLHTQHKPPMHAHSHINTNISKKHTTETVTTFRSLKMSMTKEIVLRVSFGYCRTRMV